MDDESALLRAICENPEEDTPRLAFADWLSERGGAADVAWAHGIRGQVAVARGSADEAAVRRARVLDSEFWLQKAGERLGLPPDLIAGGLTAGRWERGFPAALSGPFLALARAWPRVAFRVPARTLFVHALSAADAAEFVTWPGLRSLRSLVLDYPNHDCGRVLPVLAGCAGLSGLERLRVLSARLTAADAVAVLDSPHLARLAPDAHDAHDAHDLSWDRDELPDELAARLVTRFGPEVISDAIPF